ncbi:MAG: PKD domain-containing protein, partial [Phycisphaerae bacterium]
HRAGDLRLGEITSPSPASFTIWGEDIGTNEPGALAVQDGFITAAGPYATDIHGNGNFDAGNQQNIELATWRGTDNCFAWEDEMTFNGYSRNHPYADVGFRDFNLDGMLDLGWTRSQQTENYMYGPPLAVGSPAPRSYPFDRQRLVEDAIEVVDRLLDFDDFVDTNALDAVNCTKGAVQSDVPNHYVDADTPSDLIPDGVLSGIVLLPDLDGTIPTADDGLPVTRAWWFNEIGYFPIHNEDNDNPAKSLGSDGDISWNLFFHNFVRTLGDTAYLNKPVDCPNEFQTNSAAYAYLQTWEGLPTLFDPDIFSNAAQANNPMAIWDQMSDGCLNHTQPIFKESPCTEWIDPVDLRTVLRPGVSSTITIPPYETVRDRNAYFLENPASLGERYYFYSVGQGFDADLPGDGLLVVHTDVGANPESLPNGQQNATRFAYVIEQADGLDQLGAPIASPEANFGDAGDPFPGDSFKREFNLDSDPAAVWYAQESWTGLDVMDIQPDGQGSVALTLTWTPTSIPSLRFVDPPGGASTDGVYRIRVEATDVRGGTTIEVYSTKADEFTSVNDGSNSVTLIDSIQKVNPGTRLITFDWDVSGLDDDTYFLFAKLVPGRGADGEFEREFTEPVPGRNNRGDGTLTVQDVNIERDKARLETWTMELVNVLPDGTQDWIVFGSLSQPQPDEFASDQDPFPHLFVDPITNKGQYTSIDEEVTFTLDYTIPASESAVGDTWTFVTTGITAVSSPVTVLEGEVDEAPRAVVSATPQSPRPGEIVRFDARGSTDPNGEPLDYEWNFGDGTPPTFGAVVQHTYTQPGQFTATLKATNVNSGLFSEDRLEIIVFNNRPTASFDAFPTSGSRPLTVSFDASDSS